MAAERPTFVSGGSTRSMRFAAGAGWRVRFPAGFRRRAQLAGPLPRDERGHALEAADGVHGGVGPGGPGPEPASVGREPYSADPASLARHEAAPEWFRDAKLGIYFHWGVDSVPAFATESYPRLMHLPGHRVFEHHVATSGHPPEFDVNWKSHSPPFRGMPPAPDGPELALLYGRLPEERWLREV